ncbi:MAG TPA: TIM barrel protein [Gaiellaceae bacterium]
MIPLLSTGAVTRYPEYPDPRRILEHELPFGLELSIYRDWDESVVELLGGLPVVTAHAEKTIGATFSGEAPAFDRFELSCRIAVGLGARLVVLHLWELPDGDRYLERNLDRLPRLLDIADEHGVVLAVETIPCSVGTPIENLERACERDDRCRATLDTEFLALHGQLDLAYRLGDRIAHVHAKDFDPDRWAATPRPWNRYLIPGEGTIGVERFLEHLPFDGTVTLEASAVREDGNIDEQRLQSCLRWLRTLDG